ncbi:class IV lanthionine synthetase LanL [Streptomyces sp. 1331.2]|uniref:class IV lanthionine synthetase LanL n=1 Tax=Streptomyces sp. 1331.2 TaxID=1938835 RepID=UPI000BCB2FEE|nr:class IV lanthionine synthetase LanL [Streptomyces sp. 1331.2]SOB86311.1 Serine/threonine protein kinase [Streptomyces sp. 1331.2]
MSTRPDPGSAEALRRRVEALTAAEPGPPRPLRTDGQWWYHQDPRMPALAHGWKLHVSTRPGDLAGLLDVVVPILLRRTCDFKFARSAAVLQELNSGRHGAAAVGKAVTVYPRPDELRALGLELAQALTGWAGPGVVSDRRIRPEAPVHYRYGPFRVTEDEAERGMTGPDGTVFPGLAEARYRQPPWADDPFTAHGAAVRTATTRVGDGRYRITAGITRAPSGHVYRAVELATGREVVVKQARAFVAEDGTGTDARGRLRHERRVLAALAGVPGVPPLVDYFRHGSEEYLVSGACGHRDLRRTVLTSGPYPAVGAAAAEGQDGWELARGLLRILDAVHARGVVVCDLKPANVVLDQDGRAALVDFGVSALAGERPPGATAGYGLPDAGGEDPTEDYYALGTTLHYALTGLDPVVIDPDPATGRDRTLACLRAALPAAGQRMADLVEGLLSFDPAERRAAAARLRGGGPLPDRGRGPHADQDPVERPVERPGLVRSRPVRPARAPLDAALDHTVTTCVRMARELVAAGPGAERPRTLLSLYDGGAGLGLELLQHPDRPDARAAAADLARWTATHPALDRLDGSLYQGRTGVELFLAEAAAVLGTAAVPEHRLPEAPPGTGEGADQIAGAAGIGTGHLLLAALAPPAGPAGARHRAAAAACAVRLTTGPLDGPEDPPNPGTAALAEGFAHGRAGVAHFLLAMPDEASQRTARRIVDGLAADLPRIVDAARRPGATRRYLAWCRGLAGLGSLLVQAGLRYDDEHLLALAVEAADTCRTLAPRTAQVFRCCGLAGVGDLLVDLATATGDERHWTAAEDLAALLLTRAGGPPDRPVLPGRQPDVEARAWAVGTPGVTTFLRRLSRRGGPVPGLLPLR